MIFNLAINDVSVGASLNEAPGDDKYHSLSILLKPMDDKNKR
jgi:hypothetical protein